MTRSSILFICNDFCCWLILLLSLYIELALVCCTNPDTVHSFGTIFPNLNFKQRRASFIPMGSNQKQRCGSEFAKWHDIYTQEECADEWKQHNADLKLLKNLVMDGFKMFGFMFMTATGLENSPQSFDVYTVSQSRSEVMSAENPAPENSPQSIPNLRTPQWARGQFTRTIIPDWFKNNFHLIKYLLTTFIFSFSFQSVLVMHNMWLSSHPIGSNIRVCVGDLNRLFW